MFSRWIYGHSSTTKTLHPRSGNASMPSLGSEVVRKEPLIGSVNHRCPKATASIPDRLMRSYP